VFAGVDGEVDVVEDDVVAAGYVDVGQMQERRHSFLGYRTGLAVAATPGQERKFSGNFSLSLDVLCIDDLWIKHDKKI
jgi:hypothetical protein